MIKDAFGVEAKVGDIVAYSRGNSGAKEFYTGKVTRITAKCVIIGDTIEVDWAGRPRDDIKRTAGCFVIKMDSDTRHGGIISSANAWVALDNHIRGIGGTAGKLRDEVSNNLHKDGCQSAWIHNAQFIDALVEENAGLAEELVDTFFPKVNTDKTYSRSELMEDL